MQCRMFVRRCFEEPDKREKLFNLSARRKRHRNFYCNKNAKNARTNGHDSRVGVEEEGLILLV